MPLNDDLFRRIDLALRRAETRARDLVPAAREADRRRTQALALCEPSEARVREQVRREAAKRLAKLFARALAENRELHASPSSDTELLESRRTVADLMLHFTRERRRWKASLLYVRRRIKSAQPRARRAAERLVSLEIELYESQETAARLLVELTRKGRSADAGKRLAVRARRRSDAEPAAPAVPAAIAPISVAAARFDEELRSILESPDMSDETASLARQGMALTRTLRLSAELSARTAAGPEPGGLIRERLERCLDQWETEASRRRITILRRFEKDLPAALVPPGGFETVLDELYGGAIARAPRGTVVVAAAAAAKGGGVSLSVQDTGGVGPKHAPDALEKLSFALSRNLVELWGGKLGAAPASGGSGQRVTVFLAPPKTPEDREGS